MLCKDINRHGCGIQLGNVEVTRVADYYGMGLKSTEMFPAVKPEMWREHADWLIPGFYNPVEDRLQTTIHSWLVRAPGCTILIDSCIGNHKERSSQRFHMRNEPWLERLAAAGAKPEDIDFVMCTHLHADHVGWNTRLENGRWVPTFPNARYLFTSKEYERWDARRADYKPTVAERNVFADSILPVVEAGQMQLVDEGYKVRDLLQVEPAPGHTPGHIKLRLHNDGHHALFSGDVIHHPVQLPYPEVYSCFDDDRVQALSTRLDMLNDCVRNDILLLPTHFAAPFACHVRENPAVKDRPSFLPVWDHHC